MNSGDLSHFNNLHAGQTALLVGNGENLKLTPPEWFDYPSFGMNTIHKYEGWMPTYYTAVDKRLRKEFGAAVYEKFRWIPKFIPSPSLDGWHGDNFYRFYHAPGTRWDVNRTGLVPSGFVTGESVAYGNVMHIAIQLAAFMGFTTLLMIGMEHKPEAGQPHFWGIDKGCNNNPPLEKNWFEGYKILTDELRREGVTILNISQDTYVPDYILPRGDWREWAKHDHSVCDLHLLP